MLRLTPYLLQMMDHLDKSKVGLAKGRVMTDNSCRVKRDETSTYPNVFAIGDCAVTGDHAYPATAQVAEQQGKVSYRRPSCQVYTLHSELLALLPQCSSSI